MRLFKQQQAPITAPCLCTTSVKRTRPQTNAVAPRDGALLLLLQDSHRYASASEHADGPRLTRSQVGVELKNGVQISGTLKSVDQFLNIKLDNIEVVDLERHPHLVREVQATY